MRVLPPSLSLYPATYATHLSPTNHHDQTKVSEPAGSRLAPDKNALLVGCRGFAFLEVAVSTFEDGSSHRRGCSDYGGPLIDPARVLANIVASLHHPVTGELRVEGVSDLAPKEGEALAEGIGGLRYGEGQLRRDTGYSPEVACARGVREGVIDRDQEGKLSPHALLLSSLFGLVVAYLVCCYSVYNRWYFKYP